jgi:hypothetical protein
MVSQTEIVIGTEQQHVAVVANDSRSLPTAD